MTYPRSLRLIHWTIALLVTSQLALALVLTQLRSLAYGQMVLGLHRQLGLLILLLVVARLFVARKHKPPHQADNALPSWQIGTAALVHRLFLLLLLIQPLIGMQVAWARGDNVGLFGIIEFSTPWDISDVARDRLVTTHECVAILLFGLCVVHVGAVVFNHLVRRVSVIDRMLPPSAGDLLVNRVSMASQLTLAFGAVLAMALIMGVNALLTYRALGNATTAFQQGELAAVDQTRAAQVAWKEILGFALADKIRENASRLGELAGLAKSSLEEAASHTAPGEIRAQLEILSAKIAGIDGETPAALEAVQTVDSSLQDIVDSQALSSFQHRTDNEQQVARGHDLIVVTVLPMVLAGIIAALWLARSVTASLRSMSQLIRSIESEQREVRVRVCGTGEFAALARDIVSMRVAVEQRGNAAAEERGRFEAERVRLAEEQHAREVDAERQRRDERQAHRERLAVEFEKQVAGIADTVLRTAKSLAATADSMAHSASKTTQHSRSASAVAQQASVTASHIATGTEQLSLSARAVRENAEQSQARALLAVKEAAAAKEQIDHLLAAADQIGSITEMIAGVARQTNLLAINARVEAAHAGAVGRGLSVVADEVKHLAMQTSNATSGIGQYRKLSPGPHVARTRCCESADSCYATTR